MHVSPLGVLNVLHRSVPLPNAFGEDVEVVAVKVHWVGCGEVVAEDDADGGIGAEVVDVPFGVLGVGEVAFVGEKENRSAGCNSMLELRSGKMMQKLTCNRHEMTRHSFSKHCCR